MPSGLGCTDFGFKSGSNTYVGRNMDFPVEMNSRLSIHPIGEAWVGQTPSGNPGLPWTVQIGFVGISAFSGSTDEVDDVVDGINQKGLSGAVLTLHSSQYQIPPSGSDGKTLSQLQVLAFILGTCSTIDEVAMTLEQVYVWEASFPGVPEVPMVHYAFHDAEGGHLVVEYLKGQPVFQANLGVLTNDPPFEDQLTNLMRYANLISQIPNPIMVNGVILPPGGPGTGSIGLPGSMDSMSRFVIIATLLQFAQDNYLPSPSSSSSSLSPGQIIAFVYFLLNRVHTLPGESQVKFGNQTCLESTLWSVIKVLGSNELFYFSRGDPTLRKICLTQLDFTKPGQKKIPIKTNQLTFVNETQAFSN